MAKIDPPEKKPVAVWAVTKNGARLAVKIAAVLDGVCFIKKEHAGDFSRLLKNVANAADARQNLVKKRSLHVVNEHFETNFNAADASAAVFQHPVKDIRVFDRLVPTVRRVFADFSGHVFITAAGIAIRAVAPMIADKTRDPAVAAMDEAGRFCVSLLSGHLGGANELARKAADAVGALPVITTATDSRGIVAVDVLARRLDLAVENPGAIKRVNMALLEGKTLRVHDPFHLVSAHLPVAPHGHGPFDVFVDDVALADPDGAPLILRPKTVAAGMGCNRGTSAGEMRALLLDAMAQAKVSPLCLGSIATIDVKKDEPGLLELAGSLKVPFDFLFKTGPGGGFLGAQPIRHGPKTRGGKKRMRSSGDPGRQGKPDMAEKQVQKRHGGAGPAQLYVVGLGPGGADHVSARAKQVLANVQTVAGYTTYIDLAKDLLGEAEVISTPMKQEKKRVAAALDAALSGKSCALVSGGDPGIYAMASLVFEICRDRNIPVGLAGSDETPVGPGALTVEVVPGIPALCAGAALLGAPLTHDFAVISLSDLLTPWEKITARLEAAAKADFVLVIYNPKSKKRNWQLEAAQKIILNHRPAHTPVGVVQKASREGQKVATLPLNALHLADVDMQSIVFIGNQSSFLMPGGPMVTPRGYADKYDLSGKKEG